MSAPVRAFTVCIFRCDYSDRMADAQLTFRVAFRLHESFLKMLIPTCPITISSGPDGCAEMLRQSFLLHLRLPLQSIAKLKLSAEGGEVDEEGGYKQHYRMKVTAAAGNVWAAQRPLILPIQ